MTFSGLPLHLEYIRGKWSNQCDGYCTALRQKQLILTRKMVCLALLIPSFPFLSPYLGLGCSQRHGFGIQASKGVEQRQPTEHSFSQHRAPWVTPKSFLSGVTKIFIQAPLARLWATSRQGWGTAKSKTCLCWRDQYNSTKRRRGWGKKKKS